MKKAAVVRARIEPVLKDAAEGVLRQAGLEVSDAIRLFFRQIVEHGGLPFAVQAAPRVAVVSAAAIDRPKRVQQRAERSRRAGPERFFISPERARAAQVKWPEADYDR